MGYAMPPAVCGLQPEGERCLIPPASLVAWRRSRLASAGLALMAFGCRIVDR